MKARELRIRDLINRNGCDTIIGWGSLKALSDGTNIGAPIILTEGRLIKLGFTYRTDTGFNGWYSSPILGESIRIFQVEQGWFKYSSAHNVLKYVHQLQNLYFALTRNELTMS